MKKSIIGVAALLCLTALVGCNNNNNSESSSNMSSSQDSGSSSSSSYNPDIIRVQSVSITPGKSSVYLDSGNTIQLKATVNPTNATNKSVTWSSSDTSIATVDDNGLVTCLDQGTVRITAVSNDDNTKKDIATVTVKQYESQEDTLDALNLPSFYETYKQNTQTLDNVSDINSKELTRTNFFKNAENTKDNYRVGTDNPFKLNITGKITDKYGTDELIADPFVNVSVLKYNSTSKKYEVIPAEELANTVTVAQDKKSVQFKDASIGNLYKIIVSADTTHYKETGAGYSQIELEVEPCKGYNAYDKFDLSVFDNNQSAWNTIKEQKGLVGVESNGLVLHSDITVGNDDIPDSFKYSEAEVNNYVSVHSLDFGNWCAAKEVDAATGKAMLIGSTKDSIDVFRHVTTANKKDYAVEGNYFKVDCSGIKQVYAFNESLESGTISQEYMPDNPADGCDGSHAQLFGINNHGVDFSKFGYNGDVSFNNVTVIGNGNLSNDDKYMGGLITFKFNSCNFKANNVLTSKSFTTFLGEVVKYDEAPEAHTTMSIDRCKCYDSYNSMLYIWGVDQNIVTNSIMKRAGGAIALLDDVNAHDRNSSLHGTPKVDCYNVDFDNPVQGTEPWFNAHKATSLVQLMELFGNPLEGRWLGRNASLHGEHKNILTLGSDGSPYLNLIAVEIDGRKPLENSLDKGSMLQGHFNIYSDAEMKVLAAGLDLGKMGAADPSADLATFQQQVVMQAMLGNYLPTYRLMAKLGLDGTGANPVQGIIAATNTGHAMLFDAPEVDPNTHEMILSTGFRNGIIAQWNGTDLNRVPFYKGVTGQDEETAYGAGDYFKNILDGLASGDYMSMYLQPTVDTEYLGAFIKMQKLDMGA